MSHYTCLLVGNEDIERTMAPWMENCCGEPDKMYMKFYDEEDNYQKEYDEGTSERIVMPDGRLLLSWDKEFKRGPTEEELKKNPLGKIQGVTDPPKHLERRQVPWKELYPTLEDFAREWHGRKARDETYNRYGYWQNPNAKWDWYEIGGRWGGFFKLKPGRVGLEGHQYNYGGLKKSQDRADRCFKRDIDIEFMRGEFESSATIRYDKVWEKIKDIPEKAASWEEIRSEFDMAKPGGPDEARKKYHDQPRVKAFNALTMSEEGRELFGFFADVEDYQCTKEEYIQRCRNHAAVTHAVLKDGKWFECGEMGWWGVVRDEKDPETWNSMFQKLFDEIPDDTILTVIDCHI